METVSAGQAKIRAASLKPSYEGWKHSGELPLPLLDLVSSLPMRDGNIHRMMGTGTIWSLKPSYEGWKRGGLCRSCSST